MKGIDKFIGRKQWFCGLHFYDKHFLIQFTEIVIIIACLPATAFTGACYHGVSGLWQIFLLFHFTGKYCLAVPLT